MKPKDTVTKGSGLTVQYSILTNEGGLIRETNLSCSLRIIASESDISKDRRSRAKTSAFVTETKDIVIITVKWYGTCCCLNQA